MPIDVDSRWYDGFFENEWLELLAVERGRERTPGEGDFEGAALTHETWHLILLARRPA